MDAPDAPDSPPPHPYEDSIHAARLASESNLPGDSHKAAEYMIFSVYQDQVQQNPGTTLYGGIEDDVKCQKKWEKTIFWPPNTMA